MQRQIFQFARYGGFWLLPGGDEVLWSPRLSATKVSAVGALYPLLSEVIERVRAERPLLPEQPAYAVARLLERQGYLVEAPGERLPSFEAESLVVWESFRWDDFLVPRDAPALHLFVGAEAQRCWAYHFRPGQVCLRCVVTRWLANLRGGEAIWQLAQSGQRWRWAPAFSPAQWARWVEQVEIQPGWFCAAPMTEDERCGPAVTTPQCGCGESAQRQQDPSPLSLVAAEVPWENCATAYTGDRRWFCASAPATPAHGTGSHSSASIAALQARSEAVERYCASLVATPQENLVEVFPLGGAGPALWVPVEMVHLVENAVECPSLSHGLAAGDSLHSAQQSGLWELIERDALAHFWVGWTQGQALPARLWGDEETARLKPSVRTEVIEMQALAGRLILVLLFDSVGRVASGSAAGPEPLKMARKALAEATQNFLFLQRRGAETPFQEAPGSYREHAHYYWHQPGRFPARNWAALPLAELGDVLSFEGLVASLRTPLYFRDLTTADARQLGYRVVRVLGPELLAPPDDHAHWPLSRPRWEALFGNTRAPLKPHPFA